MDGSNDCLPKNTLWQEMIEVEALDSARQLEIEDFKASNLKSEDIDFFQSYIFLNT